MGIHRSVPLVRLFVSVAIAALTGSFPVASRADEACIARDDAPFVATGPSAGSSTTPLGRLKKRNCFTIMGRGEGRTRFWLRSADGFQGEVEVDDTVLAHVLVDDVALRTETGEEPFGKVLSGATVALESIPGSDLFFARTLEGRVTLRFLVSIDDVFPAQSWPAPDPDDEPGSSWPTATRVPPPEAANLMNERAGTGIRARIQPALFSVTDLRQDPAMGGLAYERLEEEEGSALVRIVSRNFWVDGWISSASAWANEPPARGWDPLEGLPAASGAAPLPREVGSKGAPMSLEAKGDPVGELRPGARVRVMAQQGGWLDVSCTFEVGQVRGWVEKKRLVREGKESEAPIHIHRVASVHVDKAVATWVAPEGHTTPAEEEGAEPTPLAPELDVEPLFAKLATGIQELRWTYSEEMRSGDLSGDITVRLVIDPRGDVTETTVPVDKLDNEALRALVLEQVSGLEFPARKVPRPRRGQEALDWTIQLWLQFVFSSVGS